MTTRTNLPDAVKLLDLAEELGNNLADCYGAEIAAQILRQAAQHVERSSRMRADSESPLDREQSTDHAKGES